MFNKNGFAHLLLLLAGVGLLAFFALVSFAPFRNNLFSSLFPKQSSFAFGSDDWVTRGGDFNRGYFRPTDLPLNNGKLNQKWKKFLGERIEVEMEPIVVGNSVFIGVMNGKFYALDKNTGLTQWVFQAGGPLTDTPTAFTNTSGQFRLAVPSTDGKLYVLDGTSGQKIWEYQTGEAIMSSPSFYNNTLFVGSLDKKFYAFDASDTASQRVKWAYQTTGPISTTSALGDLGNGQMGVYIANGANTAYGFNVTSSTPVWQKQLGGAYSKRTMVVYGGGKVAFVTRKPGVENSTVWEDAPQILKATKQPVDVVLTNMSDFYQTYPERRTLYFFNASTGSDLWNPLVDKTKYTPLYIPYWGEYAPLFDNTNDKFYFTAVSGYQAGLDHDMRLFQLDSGSGVITESGSSSQFLLRPDEAGRGTLIGTKYYQTISEDIGYFDSATKLKSTAVFGNGIGSHRNPLELAELPNQIFGGMNKHFTRFAGSSTSAFGGGNDAISPLVVSGNMAFFTTWGHLYAITNQTVTPTKEYLPLDLTQSPPQRITDKNQVKQMLNAQIQQIVTDNKHLDPASRFYFWDLKAFNNFWLDGETITALSEAVPFIDEPLKTQFKAYLKTQVQSYLLNANLYQYRSACLNFKTRLVEDPCASGGIKTSWYGSNYYLISDRIYAFYKYAEMTGDWNLITSNWNFIKARYQQVKGAQTNAGLPAYDATSGFFLFDGWISGPFNPDLQMAMMLATEQMAIKSGDTQTATEATNYLNVMKQKRPYWGKYVRSLYDSGQLVKNDFTDPLTWGYGQGGLLIPKEGFMDKTNDTRQPFLVERKADGTLNINFTSPRSLDPFKMTGWNFYPEFGDFLAQNLSDEISDHIEQLELIDSWWYMGDYSHQPISGGHEEDSMFPQVANDIFQAKAFVQKQSFDQLKNYLPWSFENYGYKDIFRIQNMVVLLNAPGGVISSSTPISSFSPAPSVNATKIMPLGDSLTLGVGDPASSGYRKSLLTSLINASFNPDYVGTYKNGVLSDPDHEGVSGNSISQINSRLDTGILQQYSPNIVLLLAGTNDLILNGSTAPTAITNLNALVDKIFQLQPNTTLIVGSIPYKVVSGQFTMQQTVDSYNASVQNMVTTRKTAGQKIYFSNTASAITSPSLDIISDGIHPTIAGYNKMGDIWAQSIIPLLAVATPLPSGSTKVGDIVGNNKVDIFDYNALLTDFGKKNDPNTPADLDNDNDVDIFDYNILLTNFGQ